MERNQGREPPLCSPSPADFDPGLRGIISFSMLIAVLLRSSHQTGLDMQKIGENAYEGEQRELMWGRGRENSSGQDVGLTLWKERRSLIAVEF